MNKCVPKRGPFLVRCTGDARVKGTDDAAHGPFQFHVYPLGAGVAMGCYAQRPLDGQRVVHRGDDKLGLSDEAVFDRFTGACMTSI